MSVLDVLLVSRESVLELRQIEQFTRILTDSLGVRSHNPEYHVKPATGGLFDPTRNVDALIDYQAMHNVPALQGSIEAAETLIAGAAKVSDSLGLSVVRSFYVEGKKVADIAKELAEQVPSLKELGNGERKRVVQEAIAETVSSWELVGVARLKEWARE